VETRVTRFAAELDQVFARKSSLPTLPDLMIQVQRALANELGGLNDLARVIERDPGLAARLLRVANSAALSPGFEVTTIPAAVGRLGLRQVRSLCMAVGVVQAFADASKGLDYARYWEHSAAVGLVAERLTQVSPLHGDVDGAEAYVAGLLHDVGLLLLDQFFADDFATIRQETEDELTGIWHVENRRLGLDHGEVGGRLLKHWKLPDAVVAAVTHHHHPGEGPALAGPIGQLVWAAEALCSACGLELATEGSAEVSPIEVLDRLAVPAEAHQSFLADVGDIGDRARQFTS
jgi:putative nucleotidyltransferase with HDIG domain